MYQVHDSSDTASAGSPANTISSSTPGASSSSTATALSFPQSSDSKHGDKLPDIAVVSLIPPASGNTASQSSAGQTANTREDYDSSATVRRNYYFFLLVFAT